MSLGLCTSWHPTNGFQRDRYLETRPRASLMLRLMLILMLMLMGRGDTTVTVSRVAIKLDTSKREVKLLRELFIAALWSAQLALFSSVILGEVWCVPF